MDVVTGVLYHAVGASGAALCYTPQKKVVGWSWQTYWLLQASICWLILPLVVAYYTIPQLSQVLAQAPSGAMLNAFLLGLGYGVGGTMFGLAIRHVGISLTYAIAVGISCVLGTLLPPLLDGTLADTLGKNGAGYIISGIGMGALGIALCGLAGRYKEIDIAQKNNASNTFSLKKGLPLCLLAGLLSAVYGFSLAAGEPIATIAEKYGAGNFKTNVIYIFSNSGAFVSTAIYCIYLHIKKNTFAEYNGLFAGGRGHLGMNILMALLTGVLWYAQFFFYGLGHVRMGEYDFSSWAIHMIMLVMFSTIAGLLMREWMATRSKTKTTLAIALGVLVAAVLLLTWGNNLGTS